MATNATSGKGLERTGQKVKQKVKQKVNGERVVGKLVANGLVAI